MSGHLLFVYGTLRLGGSNAMTRLHPGSKFIGNASLAGRLYDMGGYPAIVIDGTARTVAGEIYEVDDATLASLDEFETEAGYDRVQIDAAGDGGITRCWMYRPEPEMCSGKPLVASGDWIAYAAEMKTPVQD
jgi:gamma-glutamylcyclotransferase (GGCT)/AIG2-like uncharacterized protein YtfP